MKPERVQLEAAPATDFSDDGNSLKPERVQITVDIPAAGDPELRIIVTTLKPERVQ
jgi:hypothetical protein